VAEVATGLLTGYRRPLRRAAVISMHTSPTASLGHSANGGLNVYVREVCSALSDRGVATDVFTRRLNPEEPAIERMAPLSRVVYLPAGPPELDKYGLFDRVPEFTDGVARFARDQGIRYDLLYSHYWLSGAVACALHPVFSVPWVHTAHTLAVVKNRRLARGATPEPQVRVQLEGEISRCADLLVVSTPSEALDLAAAYGIPLHKAEVIAPGVDLEVFRRRDPVSARRQIGCPDSQLVLFVGRLERLKGVDIVLRAFAAHADARPDLRLLVLGEDSRHTGESEKARLIQLAAELGIQDRVEFVGPVAHHELPYFYSAASACLMPSYSESFGLVALEAQACGCPVIASNVAGLASVVRDGVTGFLVEGDDSEPYASALGRLLDDRALAAEMGRKGTLLAQRFTWQRTAGRLLAAFDRLEAGAQAGVQASARTE
jgi:D-inositol-3-phosphate glycosyltransferase